MIYDGALESLPWAGALRLLQRHFDASWVSLLIVADGLPPQSIVCRNGTQDSEVFEINAEHAGFFALDPLVDLAGDAIATVDEIIDARTWVAGECRLHIMRPAVMRDVTEADKQLCRRLLPHLRRAVELRACHLRSSAERELHLGVSERLQLGVIGLDAQGRVVYRNAVAGEILAAQDGLFAGSGRLRASLHNEDGALQKLIVATLAGAGSGGRAMATALSLTRRSGDGRFGLLLRRLPDAHDVPDMAAAGLPRLAVFIRDPSRASEPAPELVARLFGLRPAESALARLLTGGALEEAATHLNIRATTARPTCAPSSRRPE